jgi:hypothetical protein
VALDVGGAFLYLEAALRPWALFARMDFPAPDRHRRVHLSGRHWFGMRESLRFEPPVMAT